MGKDSKIEIVIALVLLLILIPAVYSSDNNTVKLNVNHTTDELSVSADNEDIVKASNDYYFNASAEIDGDGSKDNPYKYLYADRIYANSNLHLANGEYSLDAPKTIQEVRIIGSDVDRTVIRYEGVAFTVNVKFTISNVTFIAASITNHGDFAAVNSVFINCSGSNSDSYGNNYGGAVYTDNQNPNARVTIDNCTFNGNHAQYGGSLYMGSGFLNVSNSLFFNNYAYNYGGAIACDYIGGVTISKSRFYNSRSLVDAGGCIYARASSSMTINEVDIVNSSSTFGGAITSLNTDLSLTNMNMTNNHAKYDGGAIYQMYGTFSLLNAILNNNSAANGGALFIDNSTGVFVRSSIFSNNRASNVGGAIYSLLNKLNSPYGSYNRFSSNEASFYNDYYDTSQLNLTIGDGNYSMYKVELNLTDLLPSEYSLYDLGLMTPVKDQEASGNCWAFTAIAVLESCILKAGGEKLDLSEENIKNLIEMYSDYGWVYDTNEGGNDYMTWGYFTGWLGPVNETDDPFDDKSTLSPLLNSIMHIQNIKFLKRANYTQNDEIKRAIINYGAVGTSMYFDTYYYSSSTGGYFCWVNTNSNHAVTIVGWDDNYSKENFKWSGSVEGDGAWIVRNSWGPTWGDEGYFYVSYYDNSFAKINTENIAYTFILNDTIKYDRNYQYDIAGITGFLYGSSSKVWYKNKFTAACDEYLAAVSTYFQVMANWTAEVYVNGQLSDQLSGFSDSGYYTFNLNRMISLKKGDIFEVVFSIATDEKASFPVSEGKYFNKLTYGPDVSYISWDGENWRDLYDFSWDYSLHYYSSQVASIKAFTFSNPINTIIDLTVEFNNVTEIYDFTAIVKDELANPVKYGNVVFNLNGKNFIVDVLGGAAKFSHDLNKKINSISAIFEGEGYNSSSFIQTCNASTIPVNWNMGFNRTFNNVYITVNASNPINDTILLSVNGEEIQFNFTDGIATWNLMNLSNGNYTVHVSFLNDSRHVASPLMANFTVNILNTNILSSDLTADDSNLVCYNVTLVDENGRGISARKIIFAVNNSTYTNVSDENGLAMIWLSLEKGIYDVDILFEGDDDYFKCDAANTIKVKGNVMINLNVTTYKNNASLDIRASNRINETFLVLINDGPYYIDSEDGVASLKLHNLSNGIYNVRVSLNESEYVFNNVNDQFTIQFRQSVGVNTSVAIVGCDAIINIEIANATGNVSVTVDNERCIEEFRNGQATHVVKNISPGNHSLVVIYGNQEQYYKLEAFRVKSQANVSLNLSDTFKVGKSSSINISADTDGEVKAFIDGEIQNISDNKISFTPLKDGLHTIVVQSDETYEYYAFNESFSFEVVKNDPIISVDMLQTILVGQIITINPVTDSDGQVNITVNGQSINSTYLIPFKGTFVVVVKTEETEMYNPATFSTNFTSIKRPSEIFMGDSKTAQIYALDYNAGERAKQLEVILKDCNGLPITEGEVKFKYGAEVFTKATDSRGIVHFDFNPQSSGKYSCMVSYDGDATYDKTAISFTVKVNKKPIVIAAKSKTFTAKSKVKKYTITVKTKKCSSKNGKTYLKAGKKLTLKIKSKIYTAKINKKGKAVFKLKINKKGKYKAIIKFKGDATYKAASKKVTIKIK